jgi:AraC-like DNA-binding protein
MSTLHTSALRRWSTDAVAPSARLDYWVGAVCEGFLDMEVASAQACFGAELVSAPFGGLTFNRVQGSAQDVYRTRRGIARSRQDCHYLLCKTDSAWSAAQAGPPARLLPGDLLLVDASRCYEFHFSSSCSTVSIELPTAWLQRWLPDPAALTGRRIDGGSGFGRALSAFVQQLRPELALAPPVPGDLVTDQLGALLALTTTAAPTDVPATRVLRERIRQAVLARHAEPGLTAAAVAAGLGVGERSLHRALAATGQGFAALLAQTRTAAAGRLLHDPRFDRLSSAEIGRRVGWSDASHFVRVFRRVAGCTPGVYRQRR